MKDEERRRIIVAASSDVKAAPDIAAKQLRVSHAIAHDFADAAVAYSRLSETLAPNVELIELETLSKTPQQTEPSSLVLVCPLSANGTYACAPIEAIGAIVQDLPRPNVPLVYVVDIAMPPQARLDARRSPHCTTASSGSTQTGEVRCSLAAPTPSSTCTAFRAWAPIAVPSRRQSTCLSALRVWMSPSRRPCAPLDTKTRAVSSAHSRASPRSCASTRQSGTDNRIRHTLSSAST